MLELERLPRRGRQAAGRRTGGTSAAACAGFLAAIGLAMLLAVPALGAEAVIYRYINAQGDPAYSYTLPPEQAKSGYQKIDAATGRVIESVAPELPPAALKEKLRRDKAMQACRDELDRINQLYGSEADIDHARQQALDSLNTRIDQVQANLRQAQRAQDRLRAQAADAERAGQEIPATVLQSMDKSHAQIVALKAEIAQRRQEKTDTEARFAHDRERFRDGTCPGTLADARTPRTATSR